MPPSNSFDFSGSVGYNNNQYDIHDAVADHYLNAPQIVKMDEQAPVNDTACLHEELVADPSDRIGNATYHGCANHKCGRGFYLQSPSDLKNKNIT